ncbi:MAG: hypothetical protein WC241_01380 [Candidatus Paceibacterota bacterium]|jgi:hypothetical protein
MRTKIFSEFWTEYDLEICRKIKKFVTKIKEKNRVTNFGKGRKKVAKRNATKSK